MLTRTRALALAVGGVVATAGCSQPADEPPVDLQPGFYRVTLAATSAGGRSSSGVSQCFDAARVASFRAAPLRRLLPTQDQIDWTMFLEPDQCVDTPSPRAGNALAGERRCASDEIQSRFVANYEGQLSDQSFDLTADVTFDRGKLPGMPQVVHGTYRLRGRRVDDC